MLKFYLSCMSWVWQTATLRRLRFKMTGKTLLTDICHLTPTLSPKDPAFPAWWEAHKSEWEA